MIDNGIDWHLLIHEYWPLVAFISGYLLGEGVNRFYFKRHMKAQNMEIFLLRQDRDRLASDNDRIIHYTNDLITKHNLSDE